MRIASPFDAQTQPFALTIGKFDGFHIGHAAIFRALRTQGAQLRRVGYMVTPTQQTSRLLTQGQQRQLAADMGVEVWVETATDTAFGALEPRAFVQALCAEGNLKLAVVGQDFRFDRRAAGDTELLTALGREFGFAVAVIPPVLWQAQPVSSTRIRACLRAGQVQQASQMLGRAYTLAGSVQGKVFLPHANLLLPAAGCYAVTLRNPALERRTTLCIDAQGGCTLAEALPQLSGKLYFA